MDIWLGEQFSELFSDFLRLQQQAKKRIELRGDYVE